MIIVEFYISNLQKAEQNIKKIENLIVLAQVSKNKRLMLIALEEIEKTVKNCISAVLHYEHTIKRAKLSTDALSNFKTFEQKSSKNYITPQELKTIKDILNTTKAHNKSPMEFLKHGEIVILSENQDIIKLPMQKLTTFLSTTKEILIKIKSKIKR